MSEIIIFPNKTIFGVGESKQLYKYIPTLGDILFICGKHAQKTLLPQIIAQFPDRKYAVVSDINPELPLEDIHRIKSVSETIDAKIVIAIGGGSVLDAGKIAAAIIPTPYPIEEFFYGRQVIKEKGLFFVALPTTSGTGSEATPNSVLHDNTTQIKQSIRHETMIPDVAIVDPELTYNTPVAITAASGLDAITQAIESATSQKRTIFTYALALYALKLMLKAILPAVSDDKSARNDMAYGSMITGLAFTHSGLGAVHGLAHPIGSLYKIPHGKACAILLPTILRWNRDYLNKLALDLDFDSVEHFIQYIEDINQKLDIPSKLGYSISAEDVEFILNNCRSGSMHCNPRQLSDEDIKDILLEV